jgi:tetratricopeptide (TPR) repeat protein
LNLVTGLLENLAVRFGAADRIREGIRVFALGEHSRFNEYLEALRGDDPLGAELLELYITTRTRTGYPALRRRRRLLMEIARRPELATIVFEILALAYMVTGEVETAENYFLRCLELAEEKGEKSAINSVRMSLIYLKFLRAEYSSIRSEIKRLLPPSHAFIQTPGPLLSGHSGSDCRQASQGYRNTGHTVKKIRKSGRFRCHGDARPRIQDDGQA